MRFDVLACCSFCPLSWPWFAGMDAAEQASLDAPAVASLESELALVHIVARVPIVDQAPGATAATATLAQLVPTLAVERLRALHVPPDPTHHLGRRRAPRAPFAIRTRPLQTRAAPARRPILSRAPAMRATGATASLVSSAPPAAPML